jgi:hypothetical protein
MRALIELMYAPIELRRAMIKSMWALYTLYN